MKNKKIFLFLISLCFMFSLNVCAETITCDYGDYKVDYYPLKNGGTGYHIYDKTGRLIPERIDSHIPLNVSQCPNKVEISRAVYTLKGVSCGNVTDIPKKIPELTSYAITMIQIAVPVILVIMGSMDLFKGITAQKEDEIKKGQQMFVKRLIVGASIFFVVVIAKLLISVVADSSSDDIIDCIECFLSNDC